LTISIKERPGRRQVTTKPPSETREYVIRGVFDSAYAQALALAGTPVILSNAGGILYREDVKLAEAGFQVWNATIPYGPKKNESGQWTWDFDTTGGTVHVKASKQTVARYVPAGGTAVDHKQLIGVHGDDVDGADVVIPALKINVRFRHPLAVVTIPFAKQLARWTGKVNSDTFLTFSPGEVLFMGGRGSDGSDAEAEVAYSFACSENLQNQVIGAITVVEKQGWDHIWLEWEDVEDANNKPTKKPKQVNVERVYDRIPMAASFGFGA
jgi:hypothetical protein